MLDCQAMEIDTIGVEGKSPCKSRNTRAQPTLHYLQSGMEFYLNKTPVILLGRKTLGKIDLKRGSIKFMMITVKDNEL